MSSIQFFRDTVLFARNAIEDTLGGVSLEAATQAPAGKSVCMAAHYAHVIADQDYALHGLMLNAPPLVLSAFSDKAGVSSAPPMIGQPFDEWAAATTFDLAGLRAYARAVYDASDAHFTGLTDADLVRPVDLSMAGLGQQPLSFILTAGWIANPLLHAGEISLLKGLRGEKGYPM